MILKEASTFNMINTLITSVIIINISDTEILEVYIR